MGQSLYSTMRILGIYFMPHPPPFFCKSVSFILFGCALNKTDDYTPIVYVWCCSVACTKTTGCTRISLDILIIEGIQYLWNTTMPIKENRNE